MPLVLDREGEFGGLACVEAAVAVAIHFGDNHATEVEDRGVGFHGQVADISVVAVGHGDGEADAGIVGDVVGHGEREGIVHGLCGVRLDALVLCSAVDDLDVFRVALKHGFEGVHRVATDVLQGDVKVDGLAEVNLMVVVLVV